MATKQRAQLNWKRAGEAVADRRIARGYKTQEKAVEVADVGIESWRLVEQGKNLAPRKATLAAIEEVLAWPFGTIRRIAEGGPVPEDEQPSEVNERLDHLEQEMSEVKQQMRGTPPDADSEAERGR